MKLTNLSNMKVTEAGILLSKILYINKMSVRLIWIVGMYHNISKKYCSDIYEEINLFKRQINDNKLHTYSKIYGCFCLQSYLSFGLPKSLTKELTKIRISAHDLLIELGRYFK